jgi:hypothetical protein
LWIWRRREGTHREPEEQLPSRPTALVSRRGVDGFDVAGKMKRHIARLRFGCP